MGKNNPKPARKAAGVTARSARTPDGKKVTYQTSKAQKTPVTGRNNELPLDKKTGVQGGIESFGLKGVKTNSQMKKVVRSGQLPTSVAGEGKAKAPAAKYGKTSPSFKKKKP
jgi:hypothetical protein